MFLSIWYIIFKPDMRRPEHTYFLEITLVRMSVCMCACLCVCPPGYEKSCTCSEAGITNQTSPTVYQSACMARAIDITRLVVITYQK